MQFQYFRKKAAPEKNRLYFRQLSFTRIVFVGALIFAATIFNSCRATRVDLRRLAPENPVVYLETNDLGKALGALAESRALREAVGAAPDFSRLENVRLAIAVNGFEQSENRLTNETSALNFTARFVAVAETDLWEWQTVGLIENHLNDFVRKNYGADASLEKSARAGGKFFAWSATDGRRVYALAKNSRIYFGNDLAAIEKCAASENAGGDADADRSAAPSPRIPAADSETLLAFGYVSAEGVRQIADVAGVAAAASDETTAHGLIADVAPQIARGTLDEIVWTATKTERGVVDLYRVALKPEIAPAAEEIFAAPPAIETGASDALRRLPPDSYTATRYRLKNPALAWRGLLLTTARNLDRARGELLLGASDALLEPYGVADAERFLNEVDSEIVTVQQDESGARGAAIFTVKNRENIKSAIVETIDFRAAPTAQFDAEIWFSEDRRLAAAFAGSNFVIGETATVFECLRAGQTVENPARRRFASSFADGAAVAATFGRDDDSVNRIAAVLAAPQNESRRLATFYATETSFTATGFERKTTSDFGLIGAIIKQLNQ